MSGPSDEMLMAYADGELDQASRARVEAYVAANADAAERLRLFSLTGRAIGQLFDQPMHEPVPQRLVDGVRNAAINAAQRTTRKVPVDLGRPVRNLIDWMRDSQLLWPAMATAAGVVAVAVAFDWRTGGAPAVSQQTAAHITRVLSSTPSGKVERVDAPLAGTITPVLTFLSKSGAYCRQYEVRGVSGKDNVSGVGCRQPDGAWRIEIEAPSSFGRDPKAGYATASGRSVPQLEATIDRLIAGDVLGPAEETRLISKQWQPAP
jgi:surface antigen